MKRGMLELMSCPGCGSSLEAREVYEERDGEIVFGIVACQCQEYPVLEGILSVKPNIEKDPLITLLRKGERERAVAIALSRQSQRLITQAARWPARGTWGRLYSMILSSAAYQLAQRSYARYNRGLPFLELLGDTPPSHAYLKHRFSSESIWSLIALAPLLRQRNRLILDLGCGAGHSSFIISRYVNPTQLVCADVRFWLLYLAKKYMAPEASFIELDANYPLPLRDSSLDCVVGIDILHYVYARTALAKELERVLSPQGIMFMLHVHNSLRENFGAGRALPPSSWLALFESLPVRAFTEGSLIRKFMHTGIVDLATESPEGDLKTSAAFSIAGSRDSSLLRVYTNAWQEYLNDTANVKLNPLYRMRKIGGIAHLRREFPDRILARECYIASEFMPESVRMDQGLDGDVHRLAAEDPGFFQLLRKCFVLLNLPENYV